jgi:murein DD-endopeptidase MepM/ murein hydrolase activator NlpD
MGAPILAANAGNIVLASDLYFGGKTVIIDHGLGVFSSYGHMSKLLVKRGDAIAKGGLIGRAGSTGRSTGPHLHWAVRIFNARVDPFSLMALNISPGKTRKTSGANE